MRRSGHSWHRVKTSSPVTPRHRENIMLPDAKYLGSVALPASAKGQTEFEFHKFYTGQVFFTPSRFANDDPREDCLGSDSTKLRVSKKGPLNTPIADIGADIVFSRLGPMD